MKNAAIVMTQPTNQTAPRVSNTTRREAAQREHAEPVKFILDRKTRNVVGWLYKWNTGALIPMWKDGRREDVIYE